MTRKGILGTKVGMTQVFDADARVVPVTVVRAGPCPVTQLRTRDRDGYEAVQLGYGEAKRANKPLAGHFAAAGVSPKRHLVELDLDGSWAPGDVVTVDELLACAYVDVTATTKGKGFAGGIKRHGFARQGQTHGVHKVHRAPGAIGGCATPSRTFPGNRMPGRAGTNQVTIQNLSLVRVDPERGLLLIKGAVPGPPKALVVVRDAVKRPKAAEEAV
jgi:large subunit ribosomal protein L3